MKKAENNKCWWESEKLKSLCLLPRGVQTGVNILENWLYQLALIHNIPYAYILFELEISFPSIQPIKIHKYRKNTWTEIQFVIDKTGKIINKLCKPWIFMQQMKYFGVIKVNKLNISSWINHINIMLSKREQTKEYIQYVSIHIEFNINLN